MKAGSDGFVLLIVLVFLHIFSLMSIQGFASVSMKIRVNHDLWRQNLNLQEAKNVLRHLESNLMNAGAACLIPADSTVALVKKPLLWWQQFACSGNFIGKRYYYVVESLGKNACAIVQKSDSSHKVVTEYYRITLLLLSNKASVKKRFFQSTVAKASDELSLCDQTRIVTAGRQMWREV